MFVHVRNFKIAVVPAVCWVAGLVILVHSGMWMAILLLVGAAFGFAAVSRWPEEVREYAPYFAIVGWLGCVVGLTSRTGSPAFYAASAQVLPVLFLAMIVGRRFSLVGRDEPDRRVRIILMYALVLGEAYSLDALASGKEGNQAFGIVVGALVIAAISLIADVVGEPPAEISATAAAPRPTPSTEPIPPAPPAGVELDNGATDRDEGTTEGAVPDGQALASEGEPRAPSDERGGLGPTG